jgi:hypothetical protein
MLNLKKRIEILHNASNDAAVHEACKLAIEKISGSISPITPYSQSNLIKESSYIQSLINDNIVQGLIESIKHVEEDTVTKFIAVEQRIAGMHNLGVRNAITAVAQDEVATHPSTRYMVEKLTALAEFPEWLVAESAITALSQFAWSPAINERVNDLKKNTATYAEDIKIYKAVYEAKASKNNYLLTGVENHVDTYLNDRTATNRAVLLESLTKFIFDPAVKNLYNVITESAGGFQIKGNSKDAYFEKVFSLVHVNEGSEYFVVHGKPFVKTGDSVSQLIESGLQNLPADFLTVSNYLNESNVKVTEGGIKIFAKDKKIEIFEDKQSEQIFVKLNEKTVNSQDFSKVYLNSGIFRQNEMAILTAVHKIVENWNSIFELDFVKSIYSHTNPNRRVDIFSAGNTLHINKVDLAMNENIFMQDCNGMQSRNMVLEFMNYDLGNSFTSLLNKDEKHLHELESKKKFYVDSISRLEASKAKLDNISDVEVRESSEVTEMYIAICEELESLRSQYSSAIGEIKSFTTLTEGVGVNVNDEVEHLKKKQR